MAAPLFRRLCTLVVSTTSYGDVHVNDLSDSFEKLLYSHPWGGPMSSSDPRYHLLVCWLKRQTRP